MSNHHYPIEPQDRTQFIDELDELLLAKLEFACESSTIPRAAADRERHSARIRAAMRKEGDLYRAFVNRWAGPDEGKGEQSR